MSNTTEAVMSLAEIKAAIKANLGSPQLNQNAATALAGQRFLAEGPKEAFVTAVILPELSPKGKVQARLACSVEGCTEEHVREQSDWHQSMRCRTHASVAKAKLTDAEKAERALARAKAQVAALTAKLGA